MSSRILAAALGLGLLATPPVRAATITQAQATQAQTAQQAADAKVTAGKLDVLHTDLQTLIAALKAGGAVTAPTGAAVAGADAYFPADPGNALFPSPENSSMLRLGATISGRPYLRDASGSVHQLVPPSTTNPNGYLVNGAPIKGDPSNTFNQALVRQGQVYIQLGGSQWQQLNPSMGSIYNASLPEVQTAATVAAAAAEAANPTLPAPSAIAPGSSGRVLTAAPGQVAAVLATARDGDTLVLDGRYAEPVPLINVALLVRLMPGTVVDFTDQPLAQGKGGFVPAKDFVLEGQGTLRGAGIKESSAGGTACIRPAAAVYVTVRLGATITGCQNGIAGGGVGNWVLLVDGAFITGNGLGDGYTHNIYVSEGAAKVVLTNSSITNAEGGHEVKSRAKLFEASGNTITGAETLVDLPNGTGQQAVLTNNVLAKTPGAANHRIIGYGEEGASNGTAGVLIRGGTVTGGDGSFVQGVGTVTFDGTAFVGTKPTGQGVKLVVQ